MAKEFKSFFKTVGGNEGSKCHYPHRLDTYGCGCQHDCSYCYAKSLLDFRRLWDPTQPSVANVDKIRRTIERIKKEGTIDTVRLGGMTDCFMPLEKTEKVTLHTIEALNGAGIHYLIVTKSALVGDPDYIAAMDRNLAHIQVTVTTTSDELCRTYEKASPPSERIRAIEALYDAGFDVSIRLSPFIEEYLDLDRIAEVRCDKALVEFLRVNGWIEKWFPIDYSDYTVKQGGYRHLPLERKKELISHIRGFKEITVCEDESDAYGYRQHNFNPNPNDCCNLRK